MMGVLKTKFSIFLEQTQPRNILNQNVSEMFMEVKRNQENQK